MAENDDPASQQWHLDRRIPVAIIVTIAFQTGAAIWWAAGVAQRVDYIERQQNVSAPYGDRILRLEERLASMSENIVEIRNLLRQRQP